MDSWVNGGLSLPSAGCKTARIVGRPAIDRAFRTIDFLALLDLDEMDPEKILRQFEVDLRQRS